MKKIGLLIISFVLLLTGCNSKTYTWEFERDVSDVVEIKIIEVLETKDEYNFCVIKELDIELADELYFDIKNLKLEKYWGALSAPGGLCFLIMFDNGEYDIFAKKAPSRYRYYEEYGKISAHSSWLICCDMEDFNELINKYLEM